MGLPIKVMFVSQCNVVIISFFFMQLFLDNPYVNNTLKLKKSMGSARKVGHSVDLF